MNTDSKAAENAELSSVVRHGSEVQDTENTEGQYDKRNVRLVNTRLREVTYEILSILGNQKDINYVHVENLDGN